MFVDACINFMISFNIQNLNINKLKICLSKGSTVQRKLFSNNLINYKLW